MKCTSIPCKPGFTTVYKSPENKMNSSSSCEWEEIPSYMSLVRVTTLMLHDMMDGNYSKYVNECVNYIPWYLRLNTVDYTYLILFTCLNGFFHRKGYAALKRLFKSMDIDDERSLDRAAQISCHVIFRIISLVWTGILIFWISVCPIIFKPSWTWESARTCEEHPHRMTCIYCFVASIYLWNFISLLLFDEKRKDFILLLIHHPITVAVILVSYEYKTYELGLLIYFLHDINDFFLEFGKVFFYIKINKFGHVNRKFEFTSDFFVVLFTLSWALTRLYLFPLRGIHTLTQIPRKLCIFYDVTVGTVGLFILYLLNCLWYLMLLRAVVNRFLLGTFTDETMDRPDEIDKQLGRKQLSKDKQM